MMKILRNTPWFVLFVGLLHARSFHALAQPVAPVQTEARRLTLPDAVALALEKNRDLQVARLEVGKSAEQVREARGQALPSIAATGQYLHFFHKQVSFLPGNFAGLSENQIAVLRVGGSEAYQAGVSLYQPLFQAGVGAGIRAARTGESLSGAAAAVTRSNVVTATKKAYLEVLITQAQLALQQQRITRNAQALKDTRSLLAQGRASRVDTLRAFITVENLRPDLIRLTNGVAIARTVLKTTIGLDERESVELLDSLVYREAPASLPEESAVAEAHQNRPEVNQLALTAKLDKEQIALVAAGRLPQLSAVGLVQIQSQANHFRVGEYNWPLSSYVGVQVAVPLFAGYSHLARVAQAKITRQQTEKGLEQLKELIRAEVKVNLSRVEESRRRIGTLAQTVSTAELSYRITGDRWKQGIASRLDLTDAELALTQAKSNYLQAVYDYLNASVDLDQALGRLAQ